MEALLGEAKPNTFLVQARYEIGSTFEAALGIESHRNIYELRYAALVPDAIEVRPPRSFGFFVSACGNIRPLELGDDRLQLRPIDIKLTSEPSANYFAEVTYYTMALAGALVESGLDRLFVAVPNGAVWPGSHEAANLTMTYRRQIRAGLEPTVEELLDAMKEDLEEVPFEVFAPRVRHFFQIDIPAVLYKPWQELPYHVDNRCKGCDYLGYPWRDAQGNERSHPDNCWPRASREDHLSRIAFISEGASAALRSRNVETVATVAQLASSSDTFDEHQALRVGRSIVPSRAAALHSGRSGVAPDSGSSAVMPRWADLRIHLSVDFDQSSDITFAFGIKAFWVEPRPFGATSALPRATRPWGPLARIVVDRDLQGEQAALLDFLHTINQILTEAQQLHPDTSVQFYLWDSLQSRHLTDVIGRHLQAILSDQAIQHLAWLFPPQEVLENAALVRPRERSSIRTSPITVVKDIVRAVLAAPIEHYYSLLEVARVYHDPALPENVARFSVHPLFQDPLSDQIPSERAHIIWSRAAAPNHWQDEMGTLIETVRKRLDALETVVRRLGADLDLRQSAPRIHIGPPTRVNRMSIDGQLLYWFARLNEVQADLEVQRIRAMPPHEREARLESVRLMRRLRDEEEEAALSRLHLGRASGRRVYEMRRGSREAKVREGDFELALAPEAWPGFLDEIFQLVVQGTPLEPADGSGWRVRMEDVTKVTIAGIDRDNLVIALDHNRRFPQMLEAIEAQGLASFETNAILDLTHHDYFTDKLRSSLQHIGNPAVARDDPVVRRATGQITGRGPRQSPHTPAADYLWNARAMHEARVTRELGPVRAALQGAGIRLNPRQWDAWEQALTRRLQLIWGPPGTGKSRTSGTVVVGAAVEAVQNDKPASILVCAPTYRAVDTVLAVITESLHVAAPEAGIEVYRLRSYLRASEPQLPVGLTDVEINRASPSVQFLSLRERLNRAAGITIVGATPEQVHNLLVAGDEPPQQELFDLILIDEASAMDVGHAVLPLCALAGVGSLVVAGDPKQLPSIQPAEPPRGLESMVGSIYSFFEELHGVPSIMLEINYRSNSAIVEFSHHVGYQASLVSHSPDLQLNLLEPLPLDRPHDWPSDLFWTPDWATLLDPSHPLACFVYPDGRHSHWNPFEADAVACILRLLYTRMADKLSGERDSVTGIPANAADGAAYQGSAFWTKGVGIVTPHRAQRGLVINRLQQFFACTGVEPHVIRDAVDTVERFQGGQRDLMIGSFGVGDRDAIRDEEEFLMSLNRFNVMASRARAKLIVLLPQEIVDHLSDDIDILRESRLLKVYVESVCADARPMSLGYVDRGTVIQVPGTYKYR